MNCQYWTIHKRSCVAQDSCSNSVDFLVDTPTFLTFYLTNGIWNSFLSNFNFFRVCFSSQTPELYLYPLSWIIFYLNRQNNSITENPWRNFALLHFAATWLPDSALGPRRCMWRKVQQSYSAEMTHAESICFSCAKSVLN